MKGYPKTLSSREDYIYVAENFPRAQWAPDWQALLDSMRDWFFVRNLESREEGIEDATHKIETEERDDGTVVYTQYEYKVNETAKIFRIGFTEAEVRAKLAL